MNQKNFPTLRREWLILRICLYPPFTFDLWCLYSAYAERGRNKNNSSSGLAVPGVMFSDTRNTKKFSATCKAYVLWRQNPLDKNAKTKPRKTRSLFRSSKFPFTSSIRVRGRVARTMILIIKMRMMHVPWKRHESITFHKSIPSSCISSHR